MDAETGAWGDVLGEVGLDLLGPRGLAGGGVAGDYYQLLEEGRKEEEGLVLTFVEKERGGMRGKGEDLLAWWKGFARISMISDV